MDKIISPEHKIMTLTQALEWRRELAEGLQQQLVITNGCFDILHKGHVKYLYEARRQGDKLLLLLNSDASVRSLKGPARPLNDEQSRAFVAAGLGCVDCVVIFDELRCTKMIEELRPDIYVKGGDYTVETLEPSEREALFSVGADIRFINFVDGFSTTKIIGKMQQ